MLFSNLVFNFQSISSKAVAMKLELQFSLFCSFFSFRFCTYSVNNILSYFSPILSQCYNNLMFMDQFDYTTQELDSVNRFPLQIQSNKYVYKKRSNKKHDKPQNISSFPFFKQSTILRRRGGVGKSICSFHIFVFPPNKNKDFNKWMQKAEELFYKSPEYTAMPDNWEMLFNPFLSGYAAIVTNKFMNDYYGISSTLSVFYHFLHSFIFYIPMVNDLTYRNKTALIVLCNFRQLSKMGN